MAEAVVEMDHVAVSTPQQAQSRAGGRPLVAGQGPPGRTPVLAGTDETGGAPALAERVDNSNHLFRGPHALQLVPQ